MWKNQFLFICLFFSSFLVYGLPTKVPEILIYFETNDELQADAKHVELKNKYRNGNWSFLLEDQMYNLNSLDDTESPMPFIVPQKINSRLRFHIGYIEINHSGMNIITVYYIDTKNNIAWASLAMGM
ncbi:hypothetical protein AGMMS49579_16620 [Spirochaetia bacterium]|nr:hypothetical protein AGMMS49579_16620 [Spirochaetia bacterium]